MTKNPTASQLACCSAGVLTGIEAVRIDVEVDIGRGLPGIKFVGLPGASVKEAEERVKSAIRKSGFVWARQRITINLAPADLRKEGSALDLPIALAVLAASGTIPAEQLSDWMAFGELSLDGRIRPIRGALNYALLARQCGITRLAVPAENAREAALCPDVRVFPVSDLASAAKTIMRPENPVIASTDEVMTEWELDFSDVKGLLAQKRAAVVAAAGGHNMLMLGPPGSGKTMIARRIPTIMPALAFDDAIEMLRIHSAVGLTMDGALMTAPPFRAPHHTTSAVGLIGGGSPLRPGEVSLAHRGILFLDELPEFRRDLLESLRQPVEDGCVTITRARGTHSFPARFMLIAAMNPCPCGHLGSEISCACAPGSVAKYRRRISGPLLDRIDIHIEIPRRPYHETTAGAAGESSQSLRAKVCRARERQTRRFGKARHPINAQVSAKVFRQTFEIESDAQSLLEESVDRMSLSARAAEKIRRLSATIADLDDRARVNEADIAEAVSYRALDRRYQ